MTTKMASLDEYTFDLRAGLRDAAVAGLGQLEEMITELGYGWLDSHMESILERTSRGPITELMKTPSRTQTVKKTRAMTTAMKERTDKINKINLHLGSPLSKASPSRAPLSPLQPRSLNAPAVNLPPSPLKFASSPSRSKKGSTPNKAKLGVKGASKLNNENGLVVPSPARGKMMEKGDVVMLSPTPKKNSKSSQSDRRLLSSRSPSPSPARANTASQSSRPPLPSNPSGSPLRQKSVFNAPSDEPEVEEVVGEEETIEVANTLARSVKASTVEPESSTARNAVHPTSPVSAPAYISAPTQTIPQGPTQTSALPLPPKQPMRQVRSSWLSKALGNNVNIAPPVNHTTDLAGLRKSYAAPAHKLNGPIDLTNLRKSLAPAGVLAAGAKRPSDGADEEARPEKVPKVERPAQSKHEDTIIATSTTETAPTATSHTPGSTNVQLPNSASSQEGSRSTTSAQMRERQRSDIHKVTKALDELRERNAAKEAQKAKAASNVSNAISGPRPTTSSHDSRQSTAGGSGFLRNLGNIGAGLGRSLGLGGTVKSAEEEAQRLAEELEEDRRAEAEAQRQLAKLMAEVEDDETVLQEEAKMDAEAITVDQTKGVSETEDRAIDDVHPEAPVVPEKRSSRATTVEKEDEDMIAATLSEQSKPASPIKPPTPPPTTVANQAQKQRTPRKIANADVFESTTPIFSPPKREAQPVRSFLAPKPVEQKAVVIEQKVQSVKETHRVDQLRTKFEVSASVQPVSNVPVPQPAPLRKYVQEEDEEVEEEVELPELPEPSPADDEQSELDEDDIEEDNTREMPAKKMFKSDSGSTSRSRLASTASSIGGSILGQSTSTNVTHASMIAGKVLGFKPVPGHVKALALASAASKKTQSDIERRNLIREQNEVKRAEIARKKLEEDRQAADAAQKAKAAETERIRKNRIKLEKDRKEREEKKAIAAREKATKEEAERVAAKAKDEEAKKHKAAQAAILAKSASTKKAPVVITKPKEPLRAIKPSVTSSSTGASQGSKLGPTAFRTTEVTQTATSSNTITLVQPRGTLGPPSRPSQLLPLQSQNPFLPYPAHLAHGSNGTHKPSIVLQQSRTHLQAQLDEKAAEVQSEDIVLPDIASEYSDSDDSDKEPDFQRPQWAESPDLRAALEAQSTRNPDEIFGPIKPLNMEELFKIRTNKFRARTSSANWNGGDRLTRAEEVEYAKRMGFKPMGSGNGQ